MNELLIKKMGKKVLLKEVGHREPRRWRRGTEVFYLMQAILVFHIAE